MKEAKKISWYLHEGADRYLSTDYYDNYARRACERYSCLAVDTAVLKDFRQCTSKDLKLRNETRNEIKAFLTSLGLNINSIRAFNGIGIDLQQEYRYSWLKFAAMIAEEEGL